jgi:hypothetical protein
VIWLLLLLIAVQVGQLVMLVKLFEYVTSASAAERLLEQRGVGRAMLQARIRQRLRATT